ncbi:MAG: class I adenylate-forming enzyme family protein [Gammaproteobacteria bacterium]
MAEHTDAATIARAREERRRHWYAAGIYGSRSVGEALDAGLSTCGGATLDFYTVSGHRRTTVAEAGAHGRRLAGALRGLGIGPGDVVAVQMPTQYESAVLYQAVFRAGATLLPIVHIYGPAEVGFILRQSRARVLVIPDRWMKIDFIDRLRQIGSLPDLEYTIVFGTDVPAGAIAFEELQARATDAFEPPRQSADEPCLLLYTSGTTAEPKGVRHSHNTLISDWSVSSYVNDGSYLCCFPAGHTAGLNFMVRPWFHPISTVYMDHWQPELAAELIQRHRVRQSGGTPYFLVSMLRAAQAAGRDLSTLEFFSMGAASVTPAHVRLAEEHGFRAGRCYALTEHPTVTEQQPHWPFDKRARTDGRPMRNNEVRILDADGQPLPAGETGEVATRAPELFLGYTNPALDLECFMADGWFRTGDIGHLDAEGFLTITDRKKDIIIRGGENISSKEVEDVLAALPAVSEAAAVAMPDELYGEKVCVFVTVRPGASLTLDEVVAHFRASGVARQKTPERLVVLDEFPRTASSKIKKFELRARLRAGAVDGRAGSASGVGQA